MHITRFQQRITGLFLLAALLIAANAWLGFRAEETLASSERWVAHSLEVLIDLERVLTTSAVAESGVRGYSLTGEPEYLNGYKSAGGSLPSQFQTLLQLTVDNPSQVRRIEQAKALSDRRMTRLAQVIAQRQEAVQPHWGTRLQTEASQRGQSQTGPGFELARQLTATIQAAQGEERRLLAQRFRDSAHARTQARFTVALASALDLLFVVFSLWSLAYERRLRQRAAETTARLEKLQAVTEVAFTQLTVGELTTELLARLRIAAGTDVLALCRWYGTEMELTAAEGVAARPGERRQVRPGGAMARAAETGRPVRLVGEELQRLPIEALHAGLTSALVVPMTVNSQVIAMLVAGRERGGHFIAADEELLRLAADRIALALDRAAAYEAERDARQAAEASAAEILELNAVLEERVQQRTAELESTNRELEAFSYSVSHDLRAPLRSVDGFSVALAEDYGALLEGDGKHYLGRIRAGVQRMGQLIDALLQLSRITRADFSTEHVDLSALAANVAEDIQSGIPERPIHFSIQPGLEVDGDSRLLRVIFENMFGNAAKFTGKVAQPEIAFGWSPEHSSYFIRDNGAGFDQQYAGKLFVAFQRLHGDKDFQGSGIGLATVARVIRRHHGHVRAEGVVDQGATFWFTLGDKTT